MMHILFYSGEFDRWFQPSNFFKKEKLAENFDDDLDQRINTYLFGNEAEETKAFILPISITGNFYDFSGLIFAHHVRLTRNIPYCDVAIVFYGTLELDQLLRLTPLARILLTANVLYVNIAKFSFEDIQKSIEKYKTKQFDINQFTREIQINPPSNYDDNHHSIQNEFALIQWSKYIGCFESLPPQIKKEFDSQLYFKYLRVKNPLAEIKDQKEFLIPTISKPKILLIDDEAKKGWENFYSSFLKNSNIEFKDSEIDFKNQEKDKLIELVESIVINYNPDVVLLDIRLHDSDFVRDTKPENFTGLEVLEKIKKINKGIQVIITTASNKAWNFNLAKQKGAFDFIIKDGFESPELALNTLRNTIEHASNRAFYLKTIYNKMLTSLRDWNNYNIPKRKHINDPFHDPLWHINLKLQVNDFVNNAFDTINNDSIAERYTISVLLLYRVIEMINEFYVIESGNNWMGTNQYYFDQDNSKVPKITYAQNTYTPNSNVAIGTSFSTKEKSYAIYYKMNGSTNKTIFNRIHQLTEYRNKVAIHPTKRFKEESLEYIYETDFRRFNSLLNEYFSGILNYINSFK